MRIFALIRAALLGVLLLQSPSLSESYDEPLRPQFHFTAAKGWLNDPNGLVFYKGAYHLFFQHNPNGTNWVEMLSWGHAVSSDLTHWKQFDDQIPPTKRPDEKMAGSYSGTGFVDWNNTGGFAGGAEKPIVLAWTATGLGQCLAYSNDAAQTFTKFAGNPVIAMPTPKRKGDWDRDPDVFWYEPGQHWVLLYSITGTGFVVNTSTDLKHWTRQSVIDGFFECPGMFELPVDRDGLHKKWVVWDASSKYVIGTFDGKTFTKESGPFVLDHGKNYYAAQSWSDAPDGRRISIGWMRNSKFPGMPFNQQMGIASELKLRTISGQGVRLTKLPVKEVESLRYDQKRVENQALGGNANLLSGINGELFDLEAEIDCKDASRVEFDIRGEKLAYSDGKLTLGEASAPVSLQPNRRLKLRVLVDRTSIEAYANDGSVSMTCSFLPEPANRGLAVSATGEATLIDLHLWRMRSAWTQ
jgi:fructan beta-fructosidase